MMQSPYNFLSLDYPQAFSQKGVQASWDALEQKMDASLYQNWTPSFRTLAKSLTIPHYKIQCTSAFEALIDFWRSAAPWRSSTEVAVPSSDWTNVSNCKIFELQIITYPEQRTQTGWHMQLPRGFSALGCTNSDGVKIRSYKKYSVVPVSRPALFFFCRP
jgi:hypothetical protein